MGIFDVPPSRLIQEVALDLEKKFNVKKPAFIDFVKTGTSKERAPTQENWFYLRMASILYRIAKEGPTGVGSLRTYYGNKKARGSRPHRFKKASGKIIRLCMQELEKLGFIQKAKKGRTIAGKGYSYLVKKSVELAKILKEEEQKLIEKQKEIEARQKELELKKAKEVSAALAEEKVKFKKKQKPKEEGEVIKLKKKKK